MGICYEIPKTKYKMGENNETPKKSYTAGEYNETPKKNYTTQEYKELPEKNYTAQEYKELPENNYPLIEYNEKVKSKDKIEESNKKVKRNMEAPQPVSFKNNNIKNIIKMKLKIEKNDVNKPTKILYNIDKIYDDCDLKELNESNTELFINEKKYNFKIYFIPEKEGIYEIQLNIKILMKNCCCLFYSLKNLQSLDLSSFNTQNVTNMSYIFSDCHKLQNLNLSSFNTKKVTNMYCMFYNCYKLQILDLSSFDTQKVTDVSYMFENTGLAKIVVNVQDNNVISEATKYSFEILYV